MAQFQDEFRDAEIPFEEFQYKSRTSGRSHHSMSSRALLLMLALVPGKKRFGVDIKSKSIALP